jgi:hypothetical protein
MAGAGSMTEPNVLGNASPCKFLFETGNTSVVTLWKDSDSSSPISLHEEDAGTADGQDFIVPAAHVFYLMSMTFTKKTSAGECKIQGNTSPDTSVGSTTKYQTFIPDNSPNAYGSLASMVILQEAMCVKFVAGEYITITTGSGDMLCNGWGVLCDA